MIAYGFMGVILGLFMVSIFIPVVHTEPELPVPGPPQIFHTKSGCIKIISYITYCAINFSFIINY